LPAQIAIVLLIKSSIEPVSSQAPPRPIKSADNLLIFFIF